MFDSILVSLHLKTGNNYYSKNYITMKKLTHNLNIKEGFYNTPSVDIVEVVAERGFEASIPGVSISPWESDNDSLEL